MDWNLTYTKKNGKDYYMKMVQVKRLLVIPKLKLWTFFWGHGEREWPLERALTALSLRMKILFVLYTKIAWNWIMLHVWFSQMEV